MESLLALSIEPSGLRIRDARLEDHEFIRKLVPQLLAFGPPPWRDAVQMTAVDQRVIAEALVRNLPDTSVLIAEDGNGRQVGFIHLCEEEDYYGGACGHVGDVVVAPEARGQGVGKALLSAGEQWARARGYGLLTLNVFLGNEKARALYEGLGFQPETVRQVKELR